MKLKLFPFQAAGHGQVLVSEDDKILIKPCIKSEVDFYKTCNDNITLYNWIPKNFGEWMPSSRDIEGINPIAESVAFSLTGKAIILENILYQMETPCVMDIKLGKQLWADDAPLEKRKRLDAVSRSTTSGSLGFRITGILSWDRTNNTYIKRSTAWGKTLTDSDVVEGLNDFFVSCSLTQKARLVESFLNLLKLFEVDLSESYIELKSSSILFVYDYSSLNPTYHCESNVVLKLIDLAHSRWTKNTIDHNTLIGVKNLIHCFAMLLKNE